MGSRGNIILEEDDCPPIYFYTHWKSDYLPEIVHKAISRKSRWDDPQYFARIVFGELIRGNENEETGFGISTYIGDGGDSIIGINMSKQYINIKGHELSFESVCSDKGLEVMNNYWNS